MQRALAVSVACAAAACSEDAAPVPEVPREVVTDTRELLVGDLVETIFTGGPGDAVVLAIDAPVAKLDWNIHGHADGATVTAVEGFGVMTVRYRFAPTADAEWYLLLRNRDAAPMTVQVTFELHGDMQWSGWR